MANYCTVDDVRGWLPAGQSLDDRRDKPPALATVTGWVSDFSKALDAAFGEAGTAVPTDANVLAAIKIRLARELAYQVMAVRAAAEDTKMPALYLGWHKDWEDFTAKVEAHAFGAAASTTAWGFTQDSVQGTASADPSVDPKTGVADRY